MKIAIVGSQGKHWTPAQRTKVIQRIKEILCNPDYFDVNPSDPGDVEYPTLVSGGCGAIGEDGKFRFQPGVDGWAEIVADFIGLEKDIKYAPAMKWDNEIIHEGVFTPEHLQEEGRFSVGVAPIIRKGFKTRNLEIARGCDVLYCIDPAWRSWSGGRWTMREAEKLGKEVHLELIE